MANPQKENGYTSIANEILEAMAKTPLNGTQYRILFVVWRATYGFNKKEHEISETFISKATNINKRQIQREMKELIENNTILIIKDATFSSSRIISFNKNWDSWQVTKKTSPDKIDTHTGDEKDISTGDVLDTQKRNNKEKYKESIKDIFDYYLSLNLKKHKNFTQSMEKSIQKAMKENKYSIEDCKTLLERHKKVVDITKSTKYPVDARGLDVFFGQKVYQATHLICSEYEEGGKYYEKYLKEINQSPLPSEPFNPIIEEMEFDYE